MSLNLHVKSATTSLDTWHQQMGHMSYSALKLHGPSALKGMDLSGSNLAVPMVCHGCETGKSTRQPFSSAQDKSTQILDIVHSDLAGPMQTNSLQGSSYFATFIDDYSRHAVVYYLRTKDQYVQALKKFLAWAET